MGFLFVFTPIRIEKNGNLWYNTMYKGDTMTKLIYAVKAVDGKELNKIFYSWNECKPYVFGKKAVYRSFDNEKDAANFLQFTPVNSDNFGKGYVPSQKGVHTIYGKYKFDRCKEKDDGYSVRVYETQKGERFSCVGYGLPNNDRLMYAFTGEFINDPKYGYEFIVESFVEHITGTKQDIINFLSCGIIKGIGPKKAELIWQKFGNRSLEILEEKPEAFLAISGISKGVLEKIKASYAENKASKEIIYFLLKYGISQKYGIQIFNQYGANAVTRIKENPYLICRISGLTYEDADRIAKDIDYPLDSAERYEACAFYVIKQNEQTGNTGMEVKAFQSEVYERLLCPLITQKMIFERTCELVKEGKMHVCKLKDPYGEIKQFIFTHSMYTLEHEIAKSILRIKNFPKKSVSPATILSLIKEAERKFHIQLDEIQKNAVMTAMMSNMMIITGGPGTGKTTTIRVLNYVYEKLYPKNARIFLAPTGRAARKLAESTNEPSFTAHSFLNLFGDSVDAEKEVIVENALLTVDEYSMADVFLSNALFKAVSSGCTFVLVGDINQLPSVGPGAVLRDIINSKVLPVVRLQQIYRQGEDTQIFLNSQKINEGDTNILDGSDFHFHECSYMEDIKHMMGELYVKRVKEYGLGNVMCLCPFIDHTAGVNDMNAYLQALLNPKKEDEKEVEYRKSLFRIGDIVMHRRVNTEAVANGDIGFIKDITEKYDSYNELIEDNYNIVVDINNRTITYSKEDMEELTLAYASTVHKAQGGEAAAVITCLTEYHKSMLYRNIPYVAVSRGKLHVDAFGERSAWNKAILNEDLAKIYRITLTEYFLKYESGSFVKVG